MTAENESTRAIYAAEFALEQAKITEFYDRLDQIREQVDQRLAQAQDSTPTGTPSSITERDALIASLAQRRRMLLGVDQRLCFGRLDSADGQIHYIGRLGLADSDQNPILIDWRAQVAAPFYRATAVAPLKIARRRHIATTDRTVSNLDDDILDLAAIERLGLENVVGHDSLLTSLDEARTGHMRDIVATIQGEQDQIIRAPIKGTLVVQGGPGTGKTVVALHRIAYLLYEHRDTIARQGALVVGPNRLFLEYIDQVLPALGETGVTLTTIDRLVPGIEAEYVDPPDVAILKGSKAMPRILKSLVESRQRVPSKPIRLSIDGTEITLDPEDVLHAARRARDTHKPHNEAWRMFAKDLLNRLSRKLAQALEIDLDEPTRLDLVADIREVKAVRREINLLWLPQNPETLLHRLFTSPELIADVAPGLSDEQQRLLFAPNREPGYGWSASDIALLDELDELLGVFDPSVEQRRGGGPSQDELDMARRSITASGEFGGMLSADALVERYGSAAANANLNDGQHARGWVYGHIVVDEAQELSPMEWRMIYRRVPSKSVTAVGDPAQTSSPAGAGGWGPALQPFVGDRWQLERLTVNYRTPQLIMDVANRVLQNYGISHEQGTTVREGQWPVSVTRLDDLAVDPIAAKITEVADSLGQGTLAIITSQLLASVAQQAATNAFAQAGSPAAVEITVMTAHDSKGLEFDAVLLLEPSQIISGEARPGQDLYVAMTRPTQRLDIIYSSELPPELYSSLPEF